MNTAEDGILTVSVYHSLSSVSLDIGDASSHSEVQALAVERCECPWGYSGTSCEVIYLRLKLFFIILDAIEMQTFNIQGRVKKNKNSILPQRSLHYFRLSPLNEILNSRTGEGYVFIVC